MIEWSCMIALAAISAAALLNLCRLAMGPTALDRMLALDTLMVNAVAFVVLLGIWFRSTMYFESALLFAMVGFLTTVAFCKYLLRGNVIE